ncbi:MAG: DUF3052 domain-containing protein [Chloroflexi bacterium]|nr:MAG: DUF3052 domain-containing protein [Chloroflexota bacterium]
MGAPTASNPMEHPPERPLATKLGIRSRSRVALVGAPTGIRERLEPLPPDVRVRNRLAAGCDVILCFALRRAEMEARFDRCLGALTIDGGLWLCYPKQSSGVATDLTFRSVQERGLAAGLVDNKSVAIDAMWTGLRFVVPLVGRPTWSAPTPRMRRPRGGARPGRGG